MEVAVGALCCATGIHVVVLLDYIADWHLCTLQLGDPLEFVNNNSHSRLGMCVGQPDAYYGCKMVQVAWLVQML